MQDNGSPVSVVPILVTSNEVLAIKPIGKVHNIISPIFVLIKVPYSTVIDEDQQWAFCCYHFV